MTIGDAIKELRLDNGMSQKEFSSKIGVSTVAVHCWECGTKKPSLNAIVSISKTFHVSVDHLLRTGNDFHLSKQELDLILTYRFLDKYGQDALTAICDIEKARVTSVREVSNTYRYIPRYITPSAAGCSAPIDGEDYEMLQVDESVPSATDFAVIIRGESMLPYICDGETVYVKRTSTIVTGDVGIFCVDGAMYCKIFYKSELGIALISSNELNKDSNIYVYNTSNSAVRCYGKVLGVKAKIPDYFKGL